MEELLSTLTRHAMNYAIRSGITITSGYAISQCAKLLRTVEDGQQYHELQALQTRLESKIRIIAPAINIIELIAARGNTSLDSAVVLTKSIRNSIQSLAGRLSTMPSSESNGEANGNRTNETVQIEGVICEIKRVLSQLEDAVPLINLAITTSGVNMSTALPMTVSPSRLLQASTFLSAGDTIYNMNPGTPAQVGPLFTLSLYMLFGGHALRSNTEDVRSMTWKEVIHKARVKIMRLPLQHVNDLPRVEAGPSHALKAEYAYSLVIVEDLDDNRVHCIEDDDTPASYNGIALAGIRDVLPVHQISKIFYADTGRILNLGNEEEANTPVLLLKRDLEALSPRSKVRRTSNDEFSVLQVPRNGIDGIHDFKNKDDEDESVAQIYREASACRPTSQHEDIRGSKSWRLPSDLHPDWLAFEVYTDEVVSDSEDEDIEHQNHTDSSQMSERQDSFVTRMSNMTVEPSETEHEPSLNGSHTTTSPGTQGSSRARQSGMGSIPALRTSLSLLELLIRLTALQQFQQTTHLAIEDELLNFFLSESSSTGAGADSERRKAMRAMARSQVGFDPYAESPTKQQHEIQLRRPEHGRNHQDSRKGDNQVAY